MATLPVATTPAINNDPIFARERGFGIQRNAAFSSESGSAVTPDSNNKTFIAIHNMGGKTPTQAAQGLGGGSYASAQMGYRIVPTN